MIKFCLVTLLSSGDFSELISKLRITGRNEAYEEKVVYSIPLKNVRKGDLVTLVNSYGEVTSDERYEVMHVSIVKLCNSKTDVQCEGQINEGYGTNIVPGQHHLPWIQPQHQFIAKKNLSGKFINTILNAASTGSNGKKYLIIEKDEGGMQVKIERPCR